MSMELKVPVLLQANWEVHGADCNLFASLNHTQQQTDPKQSHELCSHAFVLV